MSSEASKAISKDVLWGGGRSPFSVSYGKMMMWYFLVSDALTFSGLLIAYGFVRHSSTEPWPIGEQVFQALPFIEGHYPLAYVALMTFILIVSSVTMVLAVEAGHRKNKKDVIKWMAWTVLFGFVFVGSQHGNGVTSSTVVVAHSKLNRPQTYKVNWLMEAQCHSLSIQTIQFTWITTLELCMKTSLLEITGSR